MKYFQSTFAAFRSRFFIPENSENQTISIPRLMVVRVRWIVGMSLGLNLLLLIGLVTLMNENNLDQKIVHSTANLAETTFHLSNLYGQQIEDLATGYTLYGQSLQASNPDVQSRLLIGYQEKMESFNTRSYELNHVSEKIRKQAQKIASLFQERQL